MNEFIKDIPETRSYVEEAVNKAKEDLEKAKVRDWADKIKTDPRLKENNIYVGNRGWHSFLVFIFILFLIAIIILGITFLLLVKDGMFQTIIQQDIVPMFNNTVNNVFENSNSFSNNFDLKADVIIERLEVTCREGGCNGTG